MMNETSSYQTKSQRSPEQRRQEAIERLEHGVRAIQDSNTFKAFLALAGRFHSYSWRNWVLIFSQRPSATRIAGYNAWRKLGRQVLKGETGIRILAPIVKKAPSANSTAEADLGCEDAREEHKHQHITGFRIVSVFDISQTEGDELAHVPVPILQGDEGAELYGRLMAVARPRFAVVDNVPIDIKAVGYWDPIRCEIHIDPSHSQLQRAKTLAHELAHALAGHGTKGDQTDRHEAETVAEAVAFIVCDQFGLDTSERSFPYIACFSQNMERFAKVMDEVLRLSAVVLEQAELAA
jgi:hypothetical protein